MQKALVMDRQIIQLNIRKSARQEEQFAVESNGHLLCGTLFITWKKCWSKGITGANTAHPSPAVFLGTLPLCLLPQHPGDAAKYWQHVRLPEAGWSSPGYSQLLGERSWAPLCLRKWFSEPFFENGVVNLSSLWTVPGSFLGMPASVSLKGATQTWSFTYFLVFLLWIAQFYIWGRVG